MSIASFPRAVEWQWWWAYWRNQIPQTDPWVGFLVDATTTLQQTFVTISRVLRNKPQWDTTGWTPEEWRNVLDVVDEKLSWFQLNRPRPDDIPAWARILLQALDGAYLTLRRLAQEVEQIQRTGHLVVNVSPLTKGELIERGEESK